MTTYSMATEQTFECYGMGCDRVHQNNVLCSAWVCAVHGFVQYRNTWIMVEIDAAIDPIFTTLKLMQSVTK